MKNEIINNLTAVVSALNNVAVSGKQNCLNVGGCIQVLEELVIALAKPEIVISETPTSSKE